MVTTIPPSVRCEVCNRYVDLDEAPHEHWPRPVYIVVTVLHPNRPWTGPVTVTATDRVEQYDPEWQTPLSYANTAVDGPGEIRDLLVDMADDEHRGLDYWATITSDGTVVFDGPAYQALDEIGYGFDLYARTVVNP